MKTVKQSLTSILIVLLCALMFNVPMVMAETETQTVTDVTTQTTDQTTDQIIDENGQPVDPGILPDSPFYELFDELLGKLQVALTFNKADKAALIEDQALENLAEAAVMIEEEQSENAEITLNAYSEKIAAAMEYVNTLLENADEKSKLLEALANRNSSNIQAAFNLLDKLPDQAAQRVAVNVVRTMTKSIEKYDKKIQLQLKHDLKKTTEILESTDLDEETETALEDLENIDQTEQNSDSDTDVDQDDSSTDADITEENKKKENKQETVTGQDSNPGQTNKEQKEEKNNNNINNEVSEDGQGDEIQNDNNNESGKNNGGGKR